MAVLNWSLVLSCGDILSFRCFCQVVKKYTVCCSEVLFFVCLKIARLRSLPGMSNQQLQPKKGEGSTLGGLSFIVKKQKSSVRFPDPFWKRKVLKPPPRQMNQKKKLVLAHGRNHTEPHSSTVSGNTGAEPDPRNPMLDVSVGLSVPQLLKAVAGFRQTPSLPVSPGLSGVIDFLPSLRPIPLKHILSTALLDGICSDGYTPFCPSLFLNFVWFLQRHCSSPTIYY